MMFGPLLGSILYSIGGFVCPFYVTGALLFMFIFVSVFTLPNHRVKTAQKMGPHEDVERKHHKILTYRQALWDIRILMIGPSVTLALIFLCFKEPVL